MLFVVTIGPWPVPVGRARAFFVRVGQRPNIPTVAEHPRSKGGEPIELVLVSLSLLAVVLAAALVREVRLRRALEVLLRRLLARLRGHQQAHEVFDHDEPNDMGQLPAGPPGPHQRV